MCRVGGAGADGVRTGERKRHGRPSARVRPAGGRADLDVDGLTVEYADGGSGVRPLDGLTMRARDGHLVLVLGPSGCGKTTLLSVLAGLLTPTAGRVVLGGVAVTGLSGRELQAHRRHRVGIAFQSFQLVPSLTATENVMAPLLLTGVGVGAAHERARTLLEQVGLAPVAHRRPGRLSGGEQQRVALARALVRDPPLVLADEPTAHLDPRGVDAALALFAELRRPGRLVLVATHDARLARIADATVELAASP